MRLRSAAFRTSASPSSRGLGHRPFTAAARVRIPLGTLTPKPVVTVLVTLEAPPRAKRGPRLWLSAADSGSVGSTSNPRGAPKPDLFTYNCAVGSLPYQRTIIAVRVRVSAPTFILRK
jgi:hypothetical protein